MIVWGPDCNFGEGHPVPLYLQESSYTRNFSYWHRKSRTFLSRTYVRLFRLATSRTCSISEIDGLVTVNLPEYLINITSVFHQISKYLRKKSHSSDDVVKILVGLVSHWMLFTSATISLVAWSPKMRCLYGISSRRIFTMLDLPVPAIPTQSCPLMPCHRRRSNRGLFNKRATRGN